MQLLDRSGRTVRPTDVGEVYLEYARKALRELEAGRRAIHDVQNLSRGSLRIAMTPTFTTYLIGPLMERFSTRYPGVLLKIQEMSQNKMELALAEDSGGEVGQTIDTACLVPSLPSLFQCLSYALAQIKPGTPGMIGLIPKHNWHPWRSPINIGLHSRRRCIPLDEAGRRAPFECIPQRRSIPIPSS